MQQKTLLALAFIRNVVAALPATSEKLCFNTPAFYVNKCLFARLKEDEEHLVIYTEEREKWMQKDPETFTITPHYVNYKYMLVNLECVAPEVLKEILTTAWRQRAKKTLVKQYLANL